MGIGRGKKTSKDGVVGHKRVLKGRDENEERTGWGLGFIISHGIFGITNFAKMRIFATFFR